MIFGYFSPNPAGKRESGAPTRLPPMERPNCINLVDTIPPGESRPGPPTGRSPQGSGGGVRRGARRVPREELRAEAAGTYRVFRGRAPHALAPGRHRNVTSPRAVSTRRGPCWKPCCYPLPPPKLTCQRVQIGGQKHRIGAIRFRSK
jgi:hypothetical protein